MAAVYENRSAAGVTEQEIAVIEKILQQVDRRNSTLEAAALWKLAFTLFKKVEVAYSKHANREILKDSHRVLLTGMLSLTQWLHRAIDHLSDADLAGLRLSREAIKANLVYLQRKYSQWYQPAPREIVDAVNAAFENERKAAA